MESTLEGSFFWDKVWRGVSVWFYKGLLFKGLLEASFRGTVGASRGIVGGRGFFWGEDFRGICGASYFKGSLFLGLWGHFLGLLI